MKNITSEEFEERIGAVSRARRIFIDSGITKNITDAFILYQGILAEQEREIFIRSATDGRLPSALDGYERPRCPECRSDMGLRVVREPEGKGNLYGYKTCWECFNCTHEEYSHKTIDDWMKELKKKRGNEEDGHKL